MVRQQQHSGIMGIREPFGPGNNDVVSKGAGLPGGLFGNKSDGFSSLISNFEAVKSSTSKSLLSMIVPAMPGLIGKHIMSIEPGAFSSLLCSQKDHIRAAIPACLNLGSVIGDFGDGPARVIPGHGLQRRFISSASTPKVATPGGIAQNRRVAVNVKSK